MDWWAALGYFGVVVGGLALPVGLVARVMHDKSATSDEKMPNAFLTGLGFLLGGLFWFGVGIWAFSNSNYATLNQSDEIISVLMIAVTLVTVVVGLVIMFVKMAVSKSGGFGKRVAVSSVAGIISSTVSYFAGFGGGIDIVSLSIGGVVFLTVSVLSA